MAEAPPQEEGWGQYLLADPELLTRPGVETLEQNGWLALVAFAAGPRRVRAVRIPPGRTVRVFRHDRSGQLDPDSAQDQPMSDPDEEIVYGEMVEYLRDAGVPPPPPGVHWALLLPPGMTTDQFWDHVNGEAEPYLDRVVARRSAGEVDDPPGLLPAVRRAVDGMYEQPRAPDAA